MFIRVSLLKSGVFYLFWLLFTVDLVAKCLLNERNIISHLFVVFTKLLVNEMNTHTKKKPIILCEIISICCFLYVKHLNWGSISFTF